MQEGGRGRVVSETSNGGMAVLRYRQIIIAVFVWWLATEEEWTKKILGKIQRLSCMAVAGSFRNPPTAALEVMLNLLVASSDFVSSGGGWSYCCGIDSTRD